MLLEDIENDDDGFSVPVSMVSSAESFSVGSANKSLQQQVEKNEQSKSNLEERSIPFLATISRINASSPQLSCIKTDNSSKQISLLLPNNKQQSWFVGFNLDDLNHKKDPNFSNQKLVFENLKEHFEEFFSGSRTKKLTVLVLGGSSSGKSYTLFGRHENDVYKEHGILFRFSDFIFSDKCVGGCQIILKIYMILNEKVIDLLGSPKSYAHEENVFHTEITGPIIIPLNSFVAKSLEQYMEIVTMSLMNIAYIAANICDVVSGSASVIISNTVVSVADNKIWTVEFVEMGVPFHYSETALHELPADPFWDQSYRLRSVVQFSDYLAASGVDEHDHSSAAQNLRRKSFDDSLITYILRDLLQADCSGIVIGCLRANDASFAENASTLEVLSRLDEIFHEKFNSLEEEPGQGQEGVENK